MTGYARREGGDDRLTWVWEIRSVNGRSLDIRCRMPPGFEALDPAARAIAQKRFARGNLQIALTVSRGKMPRLVRLNRDLLDQLIEIVRDLDGAGVPAAPARLDGLLALPGVLEAAEEEESEAARAARQVALEADLTLALDALSAMREAEGQRLSALVSGHLDTIEEFSEAAARSATAQPEAIRERLRAQVQDLLDAVPALPEERLAQEAAVLATKADVREEIDRLHAHVAAARDLLAAGGPVGRKLDFLCQEFNRESNTLCSKASDVALTRIGLDLKAAVDQLREQIQNIE